MHADFFVFINKSDDKCLRKCTVFWGVIREPPTVETNGCSVRVTYALMKKAKKSVIIWVGLAWRPLRALVAKNRAWAAGLVVEHLTLRLVPVVF